MRAEREKRAGIGAALRTLSAHGLFPAVAAGWSAALFGLSSLAVSAEVFGAIVVRLGLPTILPAAAPPLGMTARLLLALLLALAGGVAGLAVALGLRRRAGSGRASSVRPAARARTAQAGGAGTGTGTASAAGEPAVRLRRRDAHPDAPARRPLVLTDDLLPLVEEAAPVPGTGTAPVAAEILIDSPPPAFTVPVRRTDAPFAAPEARQEPATEVPVLDLTDWSDEPVAEPAVATDGVVDAAQQPATQPFGDPTQPPFLPHARAAFAPPPIPEPIVPGAPRSPLAHAPIETLGLVQLIERLALALAERRALREAAEAARPVIPAATVAPAAAVALGDAGAQGEAPHAPLFEPAPYAASEPLATEEATPPALLLRTKPGRAAPRSGWFDAPEAAAPSFAAPASPRAQADPFAFGAADEPDPVDEALLADDDRYSSLLNLSLSGQARHAGRTDAVDEGAVPPPFPLPPIFEQPQDEEPFVDGRSDAAPAGSIAPFAAPGAFDGAEVTPLIAPARRAQAGVGGAVPLRAAPQPVDAEGADRALREALDTLRRMTAKG